MTSSTKWFVTMMAVVFAVIIALKLLEVYTGFLWMQSLQQAAVFFTMFWTKIVLGIVVAAVFFAIVWFNVRMARRPLPSDVTFIGRRLLPSEEREQIEQYADKGLLVFVLVGAVMAGVVASGRWLEWQLFANAVPFNSTESLFGNDVGFYVFRLPLLEYVWRTLYYTVVISLVISVLIHLYMESIRLVGNTVHAIPRARAHVLSLLGVVLFLKIFGYRLAQYNLLYSTRGGNFFGASYADVHARLPVFYLMMVLAFVVGVLMFVSIRGRDYKLPGWSLGILILVSALGGSVYPYSIQKAVVEPIGPIKEQPYITANIKATLEAYNLKMDEQTFVPQDTADPTIFEQNPMSIKNVRLWDYRPLQRTYDRQQTLDTAFYNFVDVDMDRYMVGGQYRQVALSARQIDHGKLPSQTWVNEHMVYTHGYGVCMSPVNEKTPEGFPYYWIKNIPPVGPQGLEIKRPQLYYMCSDHPRLVEWLSPPERPRQPVAAPTQDQGPGQPGGGPARPGPNPGSDVTAIPPVYQSDFAIVNTNVAEYDYPKAEGGTAQENVATTSYTGQGGVPLTGLLRRLAFAARFRSKDILFTSALKPDSKIIFNHLLPDGLIGLTPFLLYDPDPYVVVVDGQLKWINDAYTYTTQYPYSKRADSPLPPLNYLRNSVKVVVDAYDGIPELYVIDNTDPMIRCYQRIFPTLFKDGAQMPQQIRAHIRYPQLQFTVQAEVFTNYHMTDPNAFYRRTDAWSMPKELYADGQRMMEPYYVIMKLPTEQQEEFLMMLPFTPANHPERNMVAWMAARCDGENYGKLICYRFPKDSNLMGPLQVEAAISQEPAVSEKFSLWGRGGSRIIRGNTLVIPIDHSVLYIEPVYIEAFEQGEQTVSAMPQLKAVAVVFEGRVAMKPTLAEALAAVMGTGTPSAEMAQSTASAPITGDLQTLIQQAITTDNEAQAMLSKGDLAGYQQKQKQVREILDQMQKQKH